MGAIRPSYAEDYFLVGRGTSTNPANAPVLWQRCHISANVMGTSAPMLWQRLFVDDFKCPSSIVWVSRQ